MISPTTVNRIEHLLEEAPAPRRRPRDAYDAAVNFLAWCPAQIERAWKRPGEHPAGILFRYAGGGVDDKGHDGHLSADQCVGCLTQIINAAGEAFAAGTAELTARILEDPMIPPRVDLIDPSHLPHFARWQRRIDAELGREAPTWKGEASFLS